jgi:hypothetical protein
VTAHKTQQQGWIKQTQTTNDDNGSGTKLFLVAFSLFGRCQIQMFLTFKIRMPDGEADHHATPETERVREMEAAATMDHDRSTSTQKQRRKRGYKDVTHSQATR